jgi:hypothetical protein
LKRPEGGRKEESKEERKNNGKKVSADASQKPNRRAFITFASSVICTDYHALAQEAKVENRQSAKGGM